MGQDLNAQLAIGKEGSHRRQAAAPALAAGARFSTLQFPASTTRWLVCLALAVFVHAAAAAALLARWNDAPEQVVNAPVITIELATLPVAPEVKPSEAPPGPEQSKAQTATHFVKPSETVEPPPERHVEALAVIPEPKPAEKPKAETPRQAHASAASAPASTQRRAARTAALAPGASSRDADAVPNWKSSLVAVLERNKRFPAEAQARGDHGTAELAFAVDRHGGVHHAHIARSSGSKLLDHATLAMIERAAPLPPPPREISGAEIPIVVPIRYNPR
jgi:protein TonB